MVNVVDSRFNSTTETTYDIRCAHCYGSMHVKVELQHSIYYQVSFVDLHAVWYIQGDLEWFEKLHKGVLFDNTNNEVKEKWIKDDIAIIKHHFNAYN